MDVSFVISGFAVGLLVGMTGVGGGSLMTPLLIGVFKLNPAIAIGTDLWFAAITKTSGSIAHSPPCWFCLPRSPHGFLHALQGAAPRLVPSSKGLRRVPCRQQ